MATLAELLERYGNNAGRLVRNIPRNAREAARSAVDMVEAIPDQAAWLGDAALGGLQMIRELSPEGQRGSAPAFDKTNANTIRDGVREYAPLLKDLALSEMQQTRDRLPRALQGSAPRVDTRLAEFANDGITKFAGDYLRNLPEDIIENPVSNALMAASFTSPKMWMDAAGGVAGAVRGLRATPGAVRAAEALDPPPARPAYTSAQDGAFARVSQRDAAPQTVPGADTASLPELRAMLASPEANPAFRVADQYNRDTFGRGYDLSQAEPGTGLAKQAGIARVFDLAASGDDAYKRAVFERYGETMPEVVKQAKAQNYDQLTEAAYRQLGTEVRNQFDRLPVRTSYHSGPGEYPTPSAMLRDVMGRGNLNVFRGGDRHDFLNEIDPATGLNSNEQFRAVHDYFGHATRGATFRPGGEELAYASHSQMLSPLAQMALAAETRGQNSWVNYGTANTEVIREQNRIRRGQELLARAEQDWGPNPHPNSLPGKQADIDAALEMMGDPATAAARLRELGAGYQYAPQSALLLPPEYLPADTKGGVPDYMQSLIVGRNGTGPERGLHFSTKDDLTRTDPSAYGTGHRGEEYNYSSSRPRTYFYTGPEGSVMPEQALFNRGPRTPYEAELSGLYPLEEDPDRLLALANAYAPMAKRTGQTVSDLERLVQTYGYRGYKGGHDKRGAAAVFDPQDVRRIGDPIAAPRPFAEGGTVDAAPVLTIG